VEDKLKISKVEYLSKILLDHTQILNLSLNDKPNFTNPSNEDNHWKTSDAKMSSKHVVCDLGVHWEELYVNLEEILSVALLNPACFLLKY
jgi:hypothetical protein